MSKIIKYSDGYMEEREVSEEEYDSHLQETKKKYEDIHAIAEKEYWDKHEYATNSREEDEQLLKKFPTFCAPGNYLPFNYGWRHEEKEIRLVRVKDDHYEEDRKMAAQGRYRDYAGYDIGEKYDY